MFISSMAYVHCFASFMATRATDSTNIQENCFNSKVSDHASHTPAFATTNSHIEDHSYIRPDIGDSRAPCPGLNTLANHGYIPRSGTNISFLTLVRAIMEVYNISLPLALMLTVPGFLIYAQFRLHWSTSLSIWAKDFPSISISYTLTLSSLASFGPGLKIAHRASLVHPDYPSVNPDVDMLKGFLAYARSCSSEISVSGSPISDKTLEKQVQLISTPSTSLSGGLTLRNLAFLRVARESTLSANNRLSGIHEQVAMGESALTWLLFAKQGSSESSQSIPLSYLAQWFGDERIPDGWTRSNQTIGLIDARKVAGRVQKDMATAAWIRHHRYG